MQVPGPEHAKVGMRASDLDGGLQVAAVQHVIIVRKHEKLCPSFRDAPQARRRQAEFVFPDVPCARMPRQIPGVSHSLLGSIVNDKKFPAVPR